MFQRPPGFLVFGSPNSDFVNSVREIAKESGSKDKMFDSGQDLEKEFPGLKAENNYIGSFDADAGILRADRALVATRVKKKGNKFIYSLVNKSNMDR